MARLRSSLESATARLRLPVRGAPYPAPTLARGIKLMYRRNKNGAGSWVVRAANGSTATATYWSAVFAVADDYQPADDTTVLNYGQAQAHARQLALSRNGGGDTATKPLTVLQAIDRYERDLERRGKLTANAKRVRYHMTAALGAKPVMLLARDDLSGWITMLKAKDISPATVNRTRVGLRAALELAADGDPRIVNRHVFRAGLKGVPNATKARRVVLDDATVMAIVAAAYDVGPRFGQLIDVLAQSGARVSQAARINCDGLRPGNRLMIPTSRKGNGEKQIEAVAVPITAELWAALRQAASKRGEHEPLLLDAEGARWQSTDQNDYAPLFARAVAGLDHAGKITSYALRHSSIVRALLAGVPISVVAKNHDTSTREIERHYAKFILDFADEVSRRGLLQTKPAIRLVEAA